MRVVVTGASGNVGTALVPRLVAKGMDVTGIARHVGERQVGPGRIAWLSLDVADPGDALALTEAFRGAGTVVHLAWRIIADHDRPEQFRVNRTGSAQVFRAAVRAGVPHLLHLSSAAVYDAAPRGHRVSEAWPRHGVPSSSYSLDKVAVENLLDDVEAAHPDLLVARIRPPAILQPAAAREVTRMMLGGRAPLARLTGARALVLPLPRAILTQVVAAADVADLVCRAILARASGAFNVADEPPLDPAQLAALLGGRHLPAHAALVRTLLDLTWRLKIQRLDGSWLDLLAASPLLDTSRARTELDWRPHHDARAEVAALSRAAGDGVGADRPPLHRVEDRLPRGRVG